MGRIQDNGVRIVLVGGVDRWVERAGDHGFGVELRRSAAQAYLAKPLSM